MVAFVRSTDDAVAGVADGATVLIGGFGLAGQPVELIEALLDARRHRSDRRVEQRRQRRHRAGRAPRGGRVRKMICSFPRQIGLLGLRRAIPRRRDRARARPSGQARRADPGRWRRIGGFFTPDRRRHPAGRRQGDRARSTAATMCSRPPSTATSPWSAPTAPTGWATSTYRKTARNFGPVMAAAAATTVIAGQRRRRPTAPLDPEDVVTPGIYVDRVVSCRRTRPPMRGRARETAADRASHRRPRRTGRRATSRPARSSTSASDSPPRSPTTWPRQPGVMLHTENGMLGMGPRGPRRRDRPGPDQRRQDPCHRAARVRRTSTTPTRSR